MSGPFPASSAAAGVAGFERIGDAAPSSPVVISVPHAGRVYPESLIAALRVPESSLIALEDRHVDAVARAARQGETLLIQHRARAWIDLNRAEDERDPMIDEGAVASASPSAKLRSGLGLVPRRAGRAGELWRRRFTDREVRERIEADHRPYHAALASALAQARDRFGTAVLLDLHSMPPLGKGGARVVLGDRFGRSSAARFLARAKAEATPDGWGVALNNPYAGGHVIARHGSPDAGIHALQVELDRSLYLDERFKEPGAGLAATAALIGRIAAALADEALVGTAGQSRLAAE